MLKRRIKYTKHTVHTKCILQYTVHFTVFYTKYKIQHTI